MRALLLCLFVAGCGEPKREIVITVPVESKNILDNYTGRARELKAKALESGDQKDILAFVEWIKKHPEERVSK